MALKSSISKVSLNVSDLERHVYEDFSFSVAQHPSETAGRVMLRIAAFAMHANERLEFGRGISTDDEPDLWLKDLTGDIELWVDLGTPDPDRLRKACSRAQSVALYAYGDRSVDVWWEKHAAALERFGNLEIYRISDADRDALASLMAPNMNLQCTISDGELWFTSEFETVELRPTLLRAARI